MKGFCSKGDLEGAMTVLHEMEVDGHSPDDITFNCLINAAVSTGDLSEACSAYVKHSLLVLSVCVSVHE